jgi:hypothetical protein
VINGDYFRLGILDRPAQEEIVDVNQDGCSDGNGLYTHANREGDPPGEIRRLRLAKLIAWHMPVANRVARETTINIGR